MSWDKLSMAERAEVMKLAVENGIYDLNTIRAGYNEFAKGGHIYDGESEDTNYMEVQKTPHVDLAFTNPWLYSKLHPAEKKVEAYEPTTFAGRVAQVAGAGEMGQKYVDYSSSAIQQVPGIGLVPSALDLGYDVNRMYHNPSTSTAKDVALDAASLLPALRKTLKGWWMKGNSGSFITETGQVIDNPRVASSLEVMLQPYRTAVNTGIYAGRAADFIDDSKAYLKDMYNDSYIGKHFPIKAYGGNLYAGNNKNGQQMEIGEGYWQSQASQPTFYEGLAEFNKQRDLKFQKFRKEINDKGKRIAEERTKNYLTTSNDATSNSATRPQNKHLEERAVEGAKSHAIWEEEHPNLTAWGNTLAAVPFAVAAAPAVLTGGEALAATAGGQAITSGLNFAANAVKATPYISGLLPYAAAALNTGMVTHGIQELKEGTFTPMTALELAPLAPPTIGIGSNLYLPHLREHVYASKAPIGYDGFMPALKRIAEGILSGRRADTENPFWFTAENAQKLQDYAYVPDFVQGAEREQYLKEFGERALRARTDMWRMYNKMPQKFNTFVQSERHPEAYTAPQDIKALKWVPAPVEGKAEVDFVNSVGGNVGTPTYTDLGNGFADTGYTSKGFGVTTTSDWWDLHPFSRPSDRIISRMQRGWNKTVGKAANKVADKIRNIAENNMYDNQEIEAWMAKNKDDEFAMEMFEPGMFPRVGFRRKVGEKLYDLSQKVSDSGKAPSFEFLKPLDEKVANFEIGKLINAKPVLVKYDVPWTMDRKFATGEDGNFSFVSNYTQGFNSENLLPQSVRDWKAGIPYFNFSEDNIKNFLDMSNLKIVASPKKYQK